MKLISAILVLSLFSSNLFANHHKKGHHKKMEKQHHAAKKKAKKAEHNAESKPATTETAPAAPVDESTTPQN